MLFPSQLCYLLCTLALVLVFGNLLSFGDI
jgi:hypothetical protein